MMTYCYYDNRFHDDKQTLSPQLLRDNLTLWTSDTQNDGEEAAEGGDN